MGIISTFSCGDHMIVLSDRQPLSADDKITYNLTMTDAVTDKTYTKVYLYENNAIRAFCALIVSDEPDLSMDHKALEEDPSARLFMA